MEEQDFIEYVSDYKVVTAPDVVSLVKKVKTILFKKDNEWEPLGGVVFGEDIDESGNKIGVWAQTLVMYDEEEIKE